VAPLERLDPDGLRQLMAGYRDVLGVHKEALNRLNVFPVPDGDTGKNMAATVESVVVELGTAGDDMASVCQAISHGSLMGAAGNSGVILSQILRGITGVAKECEAVDGPLWARSLDAAREAAYKAVQRPVEGTILTVLRESAEAVVGMNGHPLVEVLDRARAAAADALERTPEMLPKLAEAGVVDAGGAGYLLLLDAALHLVDDRSLPEPEVPDEMHGVGAAAHLEHAGGHGEEDLRYEVMYFLEAPDDTIPAFRDVWSTIGDSIVVVGGDGTWNCHIHTDDVGAAIEAAIECGRPRQIRITDLQEQVEEERWVREASDPVPPAPPEPVTTAVVAVCTGTGQQRLFRSMKVQSLVIGGQTMNPSTRELLDAVEDAPSQSVIVLPNNKNIIAVAEQINDLTDKDVWVLPTTSIPEGLSALLEYDPEDDADANLAVMKELAAGVVAAEVTTAVRDSHCALGPVKQGDWIGLTADGIKAVGRDAAGTATRLLDTIVGPEHGIVTVLEGEGATAGDTRSIREWLGAHRPGVDVEIQKGDQPHYPYLFGVE
jgi:DAK2 domain fusion protein YloV